MVFRPTNSLFVGVFVFISLLGAQVSFGHGATIDPLADPIGPGKVRIRLAPIADGLVAPNSGTTAPGDRKRLYVSDQVGILWVIDLDSREKQIFLDLRGLLVPLGILGAGSFDERGFLGVAFHPDYETNGLLYTYTSEPAQGPADFSTMPQGVEPDHQSVITEWRVALPGNPDSVPGGPREVLRIDQPQFNHDGGSLAFGPRGMLFIALGDGGSADDLDTARGGQTFFDAPTVGHGDGNGQQTRNVLGSILRIDPLGREAPNGAYSVPDDNPLLPEDDDEGEEEEEEEEEIVIGGEEGCRDGFCDEIYAYGFRNPYRISFDLRRGLLWAGDVGQNDIEEVDIVVGGGNYGWPRKEGSFFFTPNLDPDAERGAGSASGDDPGNVPSNVIDPIAEYDTHDEGHSVIGGFVYRGRNVPELRSRYVFGDFSREFDIETGDFSDGRLFYLRGRKIVEFQLFDASCAQRFEKLNGEEGLSLLGFGQDSSGELYVLANGTGTPFGETGVVRRIESCSPRAFRKLRRSLKRRRFEVR